MGQPKTYADLPEAANPISRDILVALYDEQAPDGSKTHKRPLGQLIDAAKDEATDPAAQIGGWQQVETLADRDAIPAGRRRPWMAVAVTETDTVYALVGGLGNDAWVPLVGPNLALLPTLAGAVAGALGDWRGGGTEGLRDATLALQAALVAMAARASVLEAGQAAGGLWVCPVLVDSPTLFSGLMADPTGGANHYLNPRAVKALPFWYSAARVTHRAGQHEFLKL
jgi:hypothetical protein